MEPWVLVAGGFHREGGMDRCNRALARHLIERGTPVHLVCHRVEPALKEGAASVDVVPRPWGSFMLGGLLLALRGRKVAHRVTAEFPRARVLVNGGNCVWPDINWVHYVHAAWSENRSSPVWLKVKSWVSRGLFSRREREALRVARIVITNSERTRQDVIDHLRIDPERIHTVYLGADPEFHPATAHERAAARSWLGKGKERPLVVFVGALGYDSRKGMDVLFSAWCKLCARHDWDADLVVAGGGRALHYWRRRIAEAGLAARLTLLDFTNRIPELLAAADLLVSPARYEAYGLNAQEAICCGVPAMVTRGAGVAERYPADLQELLIDDPEDTEALADKLYRWRAALPCWKQRIAPFCQILRGYTLDDMAKEMVDIALSRQ
jgi:glycosyltransferase involved in cell wall biosynthesis